MLDETFDVVDHIYTCFNLFYLGENDYDDPVFVGSFSTRKKLREFVKKDKCTHFMVRSSFMDIPLNKRAQYYTFVDGEIHDDPNSLCYGQN